MNILDCIPNIFGNVVLEEVIVEADHDEEGTHCGDDTFVLTIVDNALSLAELLEVADGRSVELGAAGEVPAKFMAEELNGARILVREVDDSAIIGVLIPRICIETGYCSIFSRSRDRLREALAIAHGMNKRIAGRLHEAGTLDSNEVEDTLSRNTPAFSCSVFAAVNNRMPDGELALIIHFAILVTTGVLDRNEVYILPCSLVRGTVRTVCINGTYGFLPDVKILDKFGSECLKGSGSSLVICRYAFGKFAVSFVSCECA